MSKFIIIGFDCGMGEGAEEKEDKFMDIVRLHLDKLDNRADMRVEDVDVVDFTDTNDEPETITFPRDITACILISHIV